MGTTLDHGIYLPDEGERNCYDGLAGNWVALDNHLGSTDIHVTINDKQAWNGHVADTTIHVTSADKQAWNGKADASALTAHTGDTTIHVTSADKQAWNSHVADSVKHVTAEDKAKWDAVTSKADDSAVVHNTGAETVAGIKTFSDDTYVSSLNFTNNVPSPSSSSSSIMPIINTITYTSGDASVVARLNFRITADGTKSLYPHENNQYYLGLASRRWINVYTYMVNFGGTYMGNEASTNHRTNIVLLANRDTDGKSAGYITRFRQNRSQGAMQVNDLQKIGFDILENEVRTNNVFDIQCTKWNGNVPERVNIVSSVNDYSFGSEASPCSINNLNPGSLGMPDLDNGIDISSYITHLDKVVNTYTPPANGWLSIRIRKTSLVHTSLMMYQTGGLLSSCEADEYNISGTNLPVTANQNVEIYIYADALVEAKFYPCQGNVNV